MRCLWSCRALRVSIQQAIMSEILERDLMKQRMHTVVIVRTLNVVGWRINHDGLLVVS